MPDANLFEIEPELPLTSRRFAPVLAALDVAWAGEDQALQVTGRETSDPAPRTYRDRHGEACTRGGSAADRRECLMHPDLFWR